MPKFLIPLAVLLLTAAAWKRTAGATIDSDPAATNNCVIDTAAILENKNLQPLIDQLKRTPLVSHKKVKEIPAFIMEFLECTHRGTFSIANPGERWQVTDVIMEPLPDRQLIWFGMSDSIALMEHFTGGWGKTNHFLIFKLEGEKIIDFWCGTGMGQKLGSKEAILDYLSANKDKYWGLNTNIIYF